MKRPTGRKAMSAAATLALVGMLLVTGCSASTHVGATLSESVDSESARAMVTAVDGDTITVTVMEEPEGGNGGSGDQSTPPEKPSGDSSNASGNDSNAPDSSNADGKDSGAPDNSNGDSNSQGTPPQGNPPSGDSNGAPQMPGGTEVTLTITDESIIYTESNNTETQASISDITEGTMLELTVSGGTNVSKIVVEQGMGQGGPGGQDSGEVNNGTAATTLDSDTTEDGKTYSSTTADENALRISGATVTESNATITKTGDSSNSEASDFYGLNAGILAVDKGNLALSNSTITTESAGSNGIFAYGEGTSVTVSDTKIRTTKDNSGGIEVAGGATLTATNLDVETQGESSAAIRSDRGGGTETVKGGTFVTNGKSSPAVYSTADVTVSDATLTSNNSQGVVIEGKNSVTLENCKITGNVSGTAYRTSMATNVMIYQSMSGDAAEGTGAFSMTGGSFKAEHGSLFYVTNTDATISLNDVDITGSYDELMTIAGNNVGWGTEGSNGATVTATATSQTLKGAITVDESSSLNLSLSSSSSFTGTINKSGKAGSVTVKLDSSSKWKLTGDSYITELTGDTSGIDLNGHTLYVNGTAWSK